MRETRCLEHVAQLKARKLEESLLREVLESMMTLDSVSKLNDTK